MPCQMGRLRMKKRGNRWKMISLKNISHYGSKQELWKQVKAYVVRDTAEIVLDIPTKKGLTIFIERLIWYRFRLYKAHSDLARLADLQRLESDAYSLKGSSSRP